ncbi:MAG: NAD-dependent epimerase/dehydratase family protein [Muribaculum sp.]|nr:NAD-dependent epimerase/dehydratase family protein [Muribaculum sp.]
MNYDNQLYRADLDRFIEHGVPWEKLHGKSILITGASGMIGTFLIDALMTRITKCQEKITIYAVSRNIDKFKIRFGHWGNTESLRFIQQDVGRPFDMDEMKVDYIIHAASNTHPREYAEDAIGTITTNVFGAYYLLEYAKRNKNCKIIMLSSVEIYGENRGDTEAFDEQYCGYIDCNTLRAGYPESKRLAEAMLQAYIAQEGIEGVIVRLCRVYGPTLEADDSKASSQFLFKACEHKDIILKSEGKQFYSYLYVSDAAKAILYAMLLGETGAAYNAASEKSDISLFHMASYLAELAGTKVLFELPSKQEQKGYSTATKAVLNAEKLKSLGWQPDYSIEAGLKRTLEIWEGKVKW